VRCGSLLGQVGNVEGDKCERRESYGDHNDNQDERNESISFELIRLHANLANNTQS
jgi:hypothetical protein